MLDAATQDDWRAVFAVLKARIEAGDYSPGDRLPTQGALARDLAVSRHAVRRALEALKRVGLVVSWQGRGVFVASAPCPYRIERRTRFGQSMGGGSGEKRTEVLACDRRAPRAEIAIALGLPHGAPALRAVLLRFVDDQPIALAKHYFDARRFPTILDALAREGSVSRALAAMGVADFMRAETRVETRLPTAQEALRLDVPPAQPVLVMTGRNEDDAGAVVEVSQAVCRGDRIQLVI